MRDSDRHLITSIHAGSTKAVEDALVAGADPNLRDMDGNIPLHYAVYQPPTVQALLKSGSLPNAANDRAETPLHHALRSRNLPEALELDRHTAVQHLLNAKADPNLRDATGRTPLHYAASRPREIATPTEQLLRAGADPSLRDHADRTPLHYAAAANAAGRGEAVEHLLARGAPINAQDPYGNTPLHCAVAGQGQDQARAITTLLDHGADLSIRDHRGQTPLALAAHPDNPVARAAIAGHQEHRIQAYRDSIPKHHVELKIHYDPGGYSTYRYDGPENPKQIDLPNSLKGLEVKHFGGGDTVAHAPLAEIKNHLRSLQPNRDALRGLPPQTPNQRQQAYNDARRLGTRDAQTISHFLQQRELANRRANQQRLSRPGPALAHRMQSYRDTIPKDHVEIKAERPSGLPGGLITYEYNGKPLPADLEGLTKKEFGAKHIVAHAPLDQVNARARGHERTPVESGPAR